MKINRKRKIYFPIQQIDHSQLPQFGKENASQKSCSQRNSRRHKIFPDQHKSNIFPIHTKNVIKPQLLLPSFHKKGIRIEKKDHGKNAHDRCPQRQDHLHLGPSLHFPDHRVAGEKADKIKDHNYKNTGCQIGKIDLPVLSYPLPGQSWIKSHFHSFSPPARAVSVLDIFSYIS